MVISLKLIFSSAFIPKLCCQPMTSLSSNSATKGKMDSKNNEDITESDDVEEENSEMETSSSSEGEEDLESSETDDDISEIEGGSSKNDKERESFKLKCMHGLEENARQICFESWLNNKSHAANLSKIHVEKFNRKNLQTEFTPWWEVVTRKKDVTFKLKREEAMQDGDRHDNWFCKASSDSSKWLSGPSSSRMNTKIEAAQIEDMNVPSIYDQRSKLKGRRARKRERKAAKEQTTGKKWYDMKAPDVDEKMKMDMEIIKMRSVLDSKRFYKNNERKGLPKFFQLGTVVDEGTDFYSSRLTKKQRKQTLVEELMADADIRQYNKKKYQQLQHKHRDRKFKGKKK